MRKLSTEGHPFFIVSSNKNQLFIHFVKFMKSYIFKLLGASRFLVIYENLYFIIFRWFLKLFSIYLLKPSVYDFLIGIK